VKVPRSRRPGEKDDDDSFDGHSNDLLPLRFATLTIKDPSTWCAACSMPVLAVSGGLQDGREVFGRRYHVGCCVCVECTAPLDDRAYQSPDGKHLLCHEHYLDQFGTQCRACSKYVEGAAVDVGPYVFHVACFVCSVCQASLAGGSIRMRKGALICGSC
jgi:hypothetical protein